MTVTEQIWFIIGISGFLIFFEAAIISMRIPVKSAACPVKSATL